MDNAEIIKTLTREAYKQGFTREKLHIATGIASGTLSGMTSKTDARLSIISRFAVAVGYRLELVPIPERADEVRLRTQRATIRQKRVQTAKNNYIRRMQRNDNNK